MKKILICLLLLANLSTGLAFAWDTHPEAMVGYDAAALELLTASDHGYTESYSESDLHHSDHCCHGAAHLMGLIVSPSSSFVASSHDDVIAFSQAPALLYIAPLLRPPIG